MHLVPYDFDFSAIVKPAYLRLATDLGMNSAEDRIYLGEFFLDELPETEALFIDKKEQLFNLIMEFEPLKKARRKKIVKYLESFYDFIEDPEHQLQHKTLLPASS